MSRQTITICDGCKKDISGIGNSNYLSMNGIKVHTKVNLSIDLCMDCAKKMIDAIESIIDASMLKKNKNAF